MTFTRQSKQIRQNLHHKPQVLHVLWRMMICLYEGNSLPYSSDFFGCFLFASDHFEHFGHLPTKGLVPWPTKASAIIAWGSSLYTGCDGNGTLSSCTQGNHGKNDGFIITPSLLSPYVYVGKVSTARGLMVVAKSVFFFYSPRVTVSWKTPTSYRILKRGGSPSSRTLNLPYAFQCPWKAMAGVCELHSIKLTNLAPGQGDQPACEIRSKQRIFSGC